MFIARVTGSLVATQKVEPMVGFKLLLVEPYRLRPEAHDRLVPTGRTFVAVDTVGAGEGEFVLITQGSSARMTPETKDRPVDSVIVGIIDTVSADVGLVYAREHAALARTEEDASDGAPRADRPGR